MRSGVIDGESLADALARQTVRRPIASELYALGYASERQLCNALAAQTGWPGAILDECVIALEVLDAISLEWAREYAALIVFEDADGIVVAAARPDEAIPAARELASSRGKAVELRIALDATIARTIRVAFERRSRGEEFLYGPEADRARDGAYLASADGASADDAQRQAQRAIAEEVSREIFEEVPPGHRTLSSEWDGMPTTEAAREEIEDDEGTDDGEYTVVQQIDRGTDTAEAASRTRALVVDPQPTGRITLVAELERAGYECQAAGTGAQALELLRAMYFDVVFADAGTPDLDGLRICRAIKRSKRLAKCRVVVTASVVDSGQIPDEVLQRHGADGYLEKPLDSRRLSRLLRELVPDERADHDALLADALARYHGGDVDGAIGKLRGAIGTEPGSPKLHFMLANMLQRASRWAEAVDEYESVVELQPAYFPALTRLAYLYFRQGLHARAIETWRRALPVCDDPTLKRNIELFMRKLVADMNKSDASTATNVD